MLKRAQPARLLATARHAASTRLALLARDDTLIGGGAGSAVRIGGAADGQALIRYRRGRYYIVNRKFAGGVFLNDRRVRWRKALSHGDRIRFGSETEYRFLDPDFHLRKTNRRILQGVSLAAVVIAAAAIHHERWDGGILSIRGAEEVAALIDSPSAGTPSYGVSSSMRPPAAKSATDKDTLSKRIHTVRVPTGGRSAEPGSDHHAAASIAAGADTAKSPASGSPPTDTTWLTRLNKYRQLAHLKPLTNDSGISIGAQAHARYLMANFTQKIMDGTPLGRGSHDEDPHAKDYSTAGATVAPNCQLAWGFGASDFSGQIDQWIAEPFHRLPMLDPMLQQAGFGEVQHNGFWVGALRLKTPEEQIAQTPAPVEFPPDNVPVSLTWQGVEDPDPLTSCPGYQKPTGLPITLQLGRLYDVRLTAYSLHLGAATVDSCAFDAHGYTNPNPNEQEYGRWALRSHGAVIMIPRQPLEPGKSYLVSITAAGHAYTWMVRTE